MIKKVILYYLEELFNILACIFIMCWVLSIFGLFFVIGIYKEYGFNIYTHMFFGLNIVVWLFLISSEIKCTIRKLK